jgi:hypothetical protein
MSGKVKTLLDDYLARQQAGTAGGAQPR